jgi:hypothetical protein
MRGRHGASDIGRELRADAKCTGKVIARSRSFVKCARSHFTAVADARRASCICSATQNHRRDDDDLKQTDRDEHERVDGVTHDDSPDVCLSEQLKDVSTSCDSTLSDIFDVCEPR